KLGNGNTVTGNLTAQGANLADGSVPRTISAVSGTLDVAHVDATTIGVPNNGQMFLNGTTQNNSFTYTVPTGSNVLIVEASDRTDAGATWLPTITYGATPQKKAVSPGGPAAT